MSDHSVSSYRARGIVFASKGLAAGRRGAAIAPAPAEDLVFRGGRMLPDMSYKIFYVGDIWATPPLSDFRRQLDIALAAAMSDPGLNDIVGQYFAGSPILTTALPSAVLNVPVQDVVNKDDVQGFVKQLFTSGDLSDIDFPNCVVNFVLPPGAVLSSDGGGEAHEADSRNGLGGYHGSIRVQAQGNSADVLYAVAVWSEGRNGIAIPGWQPWENVCATLYHELNEARTDPDVEDAIRTGDIRSIGWNSAQGQEIGDFPIEEAAGDLGLVFKKVDIAADPRTVPIQLMWSNRVHGPEAPESAVTAKVA